MHKLAPALAAAVMLVLAWPSVAAADTTRPFVLSDLRRGNRVGFDITFGSIDSGPDDVTVFGVEGLLDLELTPRLTLNGALPVVHARDGGSDYDGSSLGNLTVGLTYRLSAEHSGGARRIVGLNGSISLPTASDSGDAGLAAAINAYFHTPDPGRFLPNTTTIRFHGDYRYESGNVFFQGQLGLHQLIIDGPDDLTLLRFGLGGGVHLSDTASGLVTLTTMSDILDDSDGEDFWHQLDIGPRFRTREGELGARLIIGLDDSRDYFGAGVDYLHHF